MKYIFIFSIFFISVIATSAQPEGIVLKLKFKANRVCDSDSSETMLKLFIRKDIVRLDINGPYAHSSMIYQPLAKKVWVLYRHEKLYFSMDNEEIDRLNSMIAQVGVDLKLKYDSLSEKQKAEATTAWKDGNPIEVESPEFEKIKKHDTLVSQLVCQKFEGKLKHNKSKVIWINDFKTLHIEEEELAILNQFNSFMGNGTRALAGDLDITAFRKMNALKGYPVLIQNKSEKKVCNTIQLVHIERRKLDDKLFQVPLDYGVYYNPLGYER